MSDAQTTPLLPAGIFEGQTAFITGAGTGLGLAVATRMGRLGANIVCVSRDTGHHEQLLARGAEEGFEVLSAALDVREPADVKRVVREACGLRAPRIGKRANRQVRARGRGGPCGRHVSRLPS